MNQTVDFSRYYPLVRYISEETLQKLDFEELHIPNPCEIIFINDLAERLQKFVVLYKSNYNPKPNSLRYHMTEAELSAYDNALVQTAHQKLSSFCFLVVYNKPLLYKI